MEAARAARVAIRVAADGDAAVVLIERALGRGRRPSKLGGSSAVTTGDRQTLVPEHYC